MFYRVLLIIAINFYILSLNNKKKRKQLFWSFVFHDFSLKSNLIQKKKELSCILNKFNRIVSTIGMLKTKRFNVNFISLFYTSITEY